LKIKAALYDTVVVHVLGLHYGIVEFSLSTSLKRIYIGSYMSCHLIETIMKGVTGLL